MCTVSYIKSQGKVIITSNRDEQSLRPGAYKPQQYCINNKKIFFPKDPKAGGTWFAVDEQANVAVLLNGAEEKHIERGGYARSRGLIVLDLISSADPFNTWKNISLENIEPFTIILSGGGKLYQLRWNEKDKQTAELNAETKHIWSSVTLYPPEVRRLREQWFEEFTTGRETITEEDMQQFHLNTNRGNSENGLVINRNNIVKTFSVTQTVIEDNKVKLFHYDLHTKEEFSGSFLIM